jgi:outer membrane protein TolC
MKKLLLIIFLSSGIHAYSQTLMDSLTNLGLTMDDSTGKALAEFAAKSQPIIMANKIAENSAYDWKISRFAWFNNLKASFNLNELNIKPADPNHNVFYPRYNFNFLVPVGMIFTNGKDIKKAKTLYEGALVQKDMMLSDQKELIEISYQEYQMQRILLSLQEIVVQDEVINYTQTEEKFSNGGVTLDVFSAASKRYNAELSKRISLIHDRNVAKIKLEKLLGIKLEDALKQISAGRK